MARWTGAASAWTALLAVSIAGCSSSEGGDASSGDDDGATGGGGTQGAGAGAVASSSTGIGPGSSTTGSGGSGTVPCDPPAAPGSLYEKTAETYDLDQIDPVSMCNYRDQVLLIVNTAAV